MIFQWSHSQFSHSYWVIVARETQSSSINLPKIVLLIFCTKQAFVFELVIFMITFIAVTAWSRKLKKKMHARFYLPTWRCKAGPWRRFDYRCEQERGAHWPDWKAWALRGWLKVFISLLTVVGGCIRKGLVGDIIGTRFSLLSSQTRALKQMSPW